MSKLLGMKAMGGLALMKNTSAPTDQRVELDPELTQRLKAVERE
eukprot:SAG11_NODE_3697_length_2274_cov_1.792644_1_plen_43_part_10